MGPLMMKGLGLSVIESDETAAFQINSNGCTLILRVRCYILKIKQAVEDLNCTLHILSTSLHFIEQKGSRQYEHLYILVPDSCWAVTDRDGH